MKKRIKQIVGRLYSLPRELYEKIDQIVKAHRCILAPGARLYLPCKINNRQPPTSVVIGAHSRVMARIETYSHGGRVTIGEHCFIGENTYIWSASEVRIGNRVLISHGVNIHDTNSHSLSAAGRHQHFMEIFFDDRPETPDDIPTRPIFIEDDAWIGFGSAIFKGVTIGRGARGCGHVGGHQGCSRLHHRRR